MSFFSCDFYKSYLYLIIYWIFDILNTIEKDQFENNNKNNENNEYNYTCKYENYNNNISSNNTNYVPCGKEINLLYIIFLILTDLLFGFLVAYTKIRMYYINENEKASKKEVKKINNKYELIYNDPSQTKNKNILIILISILDFISRSAEFFYFLLIYQERPEQTQIQWLVAFDIFSRIIFSHFILKIKIYAHHCLSIIFCIFGFSIMAIFGIIEVNSLKQLIYLFFMAIPRILFALEDTINKILLTDKFLLPHFLLFFRGIVNSIIVFILTFILCLTDKIDAGYYIYLLKNMIFVRFGIKIINILLIFIKVFCIFKILYIFTPTHVGFCNVLICIVEIIKNREKKDFSKELNIICFIFNTISLILIAFGTLIFTEMIIINHFGLNENTRSGKINKEKLEDMELNIGILEKEEDNEDNGDI